MNMRIVEITEKLYKQEIDPNEAERLLLDLFAVSGSAIADLNHIAINSAMNIMALTDNEQKVQDECGKIIDAVRAFSKHYR